MPTSLTRAAIDDALTTLQSAATATGNGTALLVHGFGTVVVQVTGSFTATVTFEATLDGTTWVSVEAYNPATGATATTATAAADFVAPIAGFEYFRARVTWTSGTSVTVKARCYPGDTGAGLVSSASSGTVTANQGTAGATAWPVKGAGTAGTADTGVVTVQGIASGTPQPVVGAAASGASKSGNPVQHGGVFNTTQPTVTTGQAVEAQFSARGSQLVTPGVEGFPVTTAPTAAATGTPTSVAANAASVTVLAANSARRGASVYVDAAIGSATLYLLLNTGGTASSSNYSVALTASAPYFEVPAGYTGAVIGIWSSAVGPTKVTEFAA